MVARCWAVFPTFWAAFRASYKAATGATAAAESAGMATVASSARAAGEDAVNATGPTRRQEDRRDRVTFGEKRQIMIVLSSW